MIDRKWLNIVQNKLENFPCVALLGTRQVGKTTLAKEIINNKNGLYLDLENYQDLAKLEDPAAYLKLHTDKLIVLDEVQRKPDIFMTLRGLIDEKRQSNHPNNQFLLLGSASLDLLKQSSESLAGRITYIEMTPIDAQEIISTPYDLMTLWLRGGFPESLLANADQSSMEWRLSFIKTYLERDIPQFGFRIPAETLRRLWTMLAHSQGNPINAAKLAAGLSVSGQTITRYIDLLVDLFLVRRLIPWHSNTGKRLTRSPKIYVRDSGILHALLHINDLDDLFSHPVVGMSWEGFIIDNLLSFLPIGAETYFYRTASGAEIDLVIELPDRRRIAIEIKHSSSPKLQRGFYEACNDINPTHRYVVYNGNEKFPMGHDVYAIGLLELIKEIKA